VIYPDVSTIPNNAYLVEGTHIHPGDSFTPPSTRYKSCSCGLWRRGSTSTR
jgi:hypothetical protein